MAFAIAAGRQPKFPTHQPITKSMYFLPRESVRMLPFVAATCSSAGRSLASGSRRRVGMGVLSVRSHGDGIITSGSAPACGCTKSRGYGEPAEVAQHRFDPG